MKTRLFIVLQSLFHLKFLVALNNIAHFYIVEFMNVKSAFITANNFFNIILKAFERSQFTSVDNNTVADYSYSCISGNLTLFYITSGNCTNLRYFEYLPYLESCYDLFLNFRHKHTFHCRSYFLNSIVYY